MTFIVIAHLKNPFHNDFAAIKKITTQMCIWQMSDLLFLRLSFDFIHELW